MSHNCHSMLLGFAIIIFCGYVDSKPTCDKLIGPINNCHCRYSAGGVPRTFRNIDFSPLGKSDGTPAFTYKTNPGDNQTYAYNPCHPFKDEFCTEDTAACRRSSDEQNSVPIGNPNVVAFEVIDSDIVLTYAEVGGRRAVVNFHCDESALTAATYEPLGELQLGEFHFQIGTCLACLTDIPNCHSGGGGLGDLTVGGILCIIFTVLVLVYIVGGILFQKFSRGARGKELLPNYVFWSDFPTLIKDGFTFLIGPCLRGPGGSDYESIE